MTGERVDPAQMHGIGARHERWVAISGIANAEGFHASLGGVGVEFERHVFADHHAYCLGDLLPLQGAGVLTTSKDAVKICQLAAADANLQNLDVWVLERTIDLNDEARQQLDSLIATRVTK